MLGGCGQCAFPTSAAAIAAGESGVAEAKDAVAAPHQGQVHQSQIVFHYLSQVVLETDSSAA